MERKRKESTERRIGERPALEIIVVITRSCGTTDIKEEEKDEKENERNEREES